MPLACPVRGIVCISRASESINRAHRSPATGFLSGKGMSTRGQAVLTNTAHAWRVLPRLTYAIWRTWAAPLRLSGINLFTRYQLPFRMYNATTLPQLPLSYSRTRDPAVTLVSAEYSVSHNRVVLKFDFGNAAPTPDSVVGWSYTHVYFHQLVYETAPWTPGHLQKTMTPIFPGPPPLLSIEAHFVGLTLGFRESMKQIMPIAITTIP